MTSPPVPAALEAVIPQTFLARLPDDLVHEIVSRGRRVEVARGAMLTQNPTKPGLSIVVEGLVRSFLRSPQGREVTLRYARPGEMLGLVQMLRGRLDVHAQALTVTVLWTLSPRLVRELAMQSAPLAMALAEDCAQRVVDAAEEVANVTFGSVRQRVARHLLDLAAADSAGDLVAPVTSQTLADATGSVREVVARALRDLESIGVIGRSPSGITILDAAILDGEARGRAVVNGDAKT